MKTIPWQPGFTWRKLGYLTSSNSLNYRDVINQNPSWNVTLEPPIGAVIRLDGNSSLGGLQGLPTSVGSISPVTARYIYPYDSVPEYTEALVRYAPSTLMNVDRFNGWSMDSIPAATGIQ